MKKQDLRKIIREEIAIVRRNLSLKEEADFEAYYNNKKITIKAKDLWDAKQKAIQQLKVPKSKQGLVAVQSLKSKANQDFRFEAAEKNPLIGRTITVNAGRYKNAKGTIIKAPSAGTNSVTALMDDGKKIIVHAVDFKLDEALHKEKFRLRGKTYDAFVFGTDDAANKFMTKNSGWGVIGVKEKPDYKVYVAQNTDLGEIKEDYNWNNEPDNKIYWKPKNLKKVGWIVISQAKNDGRPLYALYDTDDKKWGATYRMGTSKYSESSPLFYTVPIKVEGNKFRILSENEKWSRPYAYHKIELKGKDY